MNRNPRHAALAVVLFLLAGSALAGTTDVDKRQINDQIRHFAVERIALRVQLLELEKGIVNLQQGPVSIMSRTFPEGVRWHVEINDKATGSQIGTIRRSQNYPSPCRHYPTT